jgi:HD-GYP domain-containing protein (c-di-GMP phosphodiesterase class II)
MKNDSNTNLMDANGFIPIRVSTLRGDLPISFDVYVRVADKYILYCRQGESFEDKRLQRLKEKKIKQLYIASSSEGDYRRYLSYNIEAAYAGVPEKPVETRAQIAQGLQQAATEDMLENSTIELQYDVFNGDTARYIRFVLEENQALRAILKIENSNNSIAHHGVNVATLALSLAQLVGVKEKERLQRLAVGCLLHDLEHTYSGLNVARPLSQLNPPELEIYQRHPLSGVNRINAVSFYHPTVIKIMLSHHEYIDGSGFPDHCKENDLDELVLIAAVCDSYDRLINFEGMKPKEAIKQLLISKVGLLKLDYMQALATLLKDRGFT